MLNAILERGSTPFYHFPPKDHTPVDKLNRTGFLINNEYIWFTFHHSPYQMPEIFAKKPTDAKFGEHFEGKLREEPYVAQNTNYLDVRPQCIDGLLWDDDMSLQAIVKLASVMSSPCIEDTFKDDACMSAHDKRRSWRNGPRSDLRDLAEDNPVRNNTYTALTSGVGKLLMERYLGPSTTIYTALLNNIQYKAQKECQRIIDRYQEEEKAMLAQSKLKPLSVEEQRERLRALAAGKKPETRYRRVLSFGDFNLAERLEFTQTMRPAVNLFFSFLDKESRNNYDLRNHPSGVANYLVN